MKKFIKRFILSFHNEWRQILGKYNWYTMTLANIYFEYDKWMQGLVFEVTMLGFGFTLRYNLPTSDAIFQKMEEEFKKTMKKYKK